VYVWFSSKVVLNHCLLKSSINTMSCHTMNIDLCWFSFFKSLFLQLQDHLRQNWQERWWESDRGGAERLDRIRAEPLPACRHRPTVEWTESRRHSNTVLGCVQAPSLWLCWRFAACCIYTLCIILVCVLKIQIGCLRQRKEFLFMFYRSISVVLYILPSDS